MRIAMVDAGARSKHVAELAAAQRQLGHHVVVHAQPGKSDMGDFAKALYTEWQSDPPDVVHAHYWTSGLAAVLGARRGRMPLVQTYHALGLVEQQYVDNSGMDERINIERLLGREVARVAASSSAEVFELVRMGLPRSVIAVVPWGVDAEAFSPMGEAATPKRLPRIVTVGKLLPHNGFDDVLHAVSKVEDVELVVAGAPRRRRGDPELKRLRALARELGIARRVVFAGALPPAEMPALLRSADIAVCAPRCEAFGIVAVEAMACGVPVVATTVGGLPDTVIDGVTGRHVPPGQPDVLARVLHGLLADDTLRQEFGAAGFDRVCARYTWPRIAEDMVRLYQGAGAAPGKVSGAVSPR